MICVQAGHGINKRVEEITNCTAAEKRTKRRGMLGTISIFFS